MGKDPRLAGEINNYRKDKNLVSGDKIIFKKYCKNEEILYFIECKHKNKESVLENKCSNKSQKWTTISLSTI
ncbi:hypothetical protein LL033_05095 [Clostridium estertheticum]|uniref:hypothetical protein n=1 Tax=Clostridium estertheticum TaxID=238834 RepID=UPI001C0AF118|nr:hypothetical protein [Clostridium estertheticum]MBU3217445.1 hypothetical protein [Clostridium estertheticum]WAG56623.1 hypothetical protein LL033_05095 [Clostridium estertheticum]